MVTLNFDDPFYRDNLIYDLNFPYKIYIIMVKYNLILNDKSFLDLYFILTIVVYKSLKI